MTEVSCDKADFSELMTVSELAISRIRCGLSKEQRMCEVASSLTVICSEKSALSQLTFVTTLLRLPYRSETYAYVSLLLICNIFPLGMGVIS